MSSTKYYYAHKEQCLEVVRRYREANIEKIKARQKEYYYRVLKERRRVDRMYAASGRPPVVARPKKLLQAPGIKTTRTFLNEPLELVQIAATEPDVVRSMTVERLPGIELDWNKL